MNGSDGVQTNRPSSSVHQFTEHENPETKESSSLKGFNAIQLMRQLGSFIQDRIVNTNTYRKLKASIKGKLGTDIDSQVKSAMKLIAKLENNEERIEKIERIITKTVERLKRNDNAESKALQGYLLAKLEFEKELREQIIIGNLFLRPDQKLTLKKDRENFIDLDASKDLKEKMTKLKSSRVILFHELLKPKGNGVGKIFKTVQESDKAFNILQRSDYISRLHRNEGIPISQIQDVLYEALTAKTSSDVASDPLKDYQVQKLEFEMQLRQLKAVMDRMESWGMVESAPKSLEDLRAHIENKTEFQDPVFNELVDKSGVKGISAELTDNIQKAKKRCLDRLGDRVKFEEIATSSHSDTEIKLAHKNDFDKRIQKNSEFISRLKENATFDESVILDKIQELMDEKRKIPEEQTNLKAINNYELARFRFEWDLRALKSALDLMEKNGFIDSSPDLEELRARVGEIYLSIDNDLREFILNSNILVSYEKLQLLNYVELMMKNPIEAASIAEMANSRTCLQIRENLEIHGCCVLSGGPGTGKSEFVEIAVGPHKTLDLREWCLAEFLAMGKTKEDFNTPAGKALLNNYLSKNLDEIRDQLANSKNKCIVLDEFDLFIEDPPTNDEIETVNMIVKLAAELRGKYGKEVILVMHRNVQMQSERDKYIFNTETFSVMLGENGFFDEQKTEISYLDQREQEVILGSLGFSEDEVTDYISKANGYPGAYLPYLRWVADPNASIETKPAKEQFISQAKERIQANIRACKHILKKSDMEALNAIAMNQTPGEYDEKSLLMTGLVTKDESGQLMIPEIVKEIFISQSS